MLIIEFAYFLFNACYYLIARDKGAFTNDSIILVGRGFGIDDGRRRCWAKDDVPFFNMISGENSKPFDLKSWFYCKKISLIIRKLSRSSN